MAKEKKLSLSQKATAWTIWKYLQFVKSTSKPIFEPSDAEERLAKLHPAIISVWHGQFLLAAFLRPKDAKARVIVARHGDAVVIGRVMEKFGTGIISGGGSGGSTKDKGGKAALKGALDTLKAGESVVLTADVPPGPARQVGMGTITMARMSGKPIVPVAVATSRYKSMNSWSRFTINFPFSRHVVVVGDPVSVPRKCSADELEQYRQDLETSLFAMTHKAYELAGVSERAATPLAYRELKKTTPRLKLYQAATQLARPVLPLLLSRRVAKGKEEPARLGERYGEPGEARPEGELIWFHAASVGEVNAILRLLDEIRQRDPAQNILLTTMTTTSAKVVQQRAPEGVIHQFVPLDATIYLRKFLDHWQPDQLILVESEIWPNMILESDARDIPISIINGRMSKKSFRKWRKQPETAHNIFGRMHKVLAQNHQYALWFHRLGAKQVHVTGSLKFDNPPLPANEQDLRAFQEQIRSRPVWLAASTHPGEDEQVIEAHKKLSIELPEILTIIVPRHPHRGDDIKELAVDEGAVQRSKSEDIKPETGIYIADTLGELGLFYRAVPATFIGGSLIEHGGQNPIEAIQLDTAIVTGPHVHNFHDVYHTLGKKGGVQTAYSSAKLAEIVLALLHDQTLGEQQNTNAKKVIEGLGGALEKTLALLEEGQAT